MVQFLASVFIFGTIGVFRRYIPFSSAFIAFFRGVSGGLFLLLFVRLARKGRQEKLPFGILLRLILTGAVMGLNWILLFEAYNYTTVGIATLCYYMQPVIVTLLSPVVFHEKLTGKKALCAAAAIIGMVLVSGVAGGTRGGDGRGILLGLGAAVLYSVVVIMNKKTPGLDAYRKTIVQLLSAGMVMVPYLLLTGGAGGNASVTGVILLLVVGLVHTGIAYVLYFGSMDNLKAQTIAILSYVDPVTAFLLSALLLREPLSTAGIIGAVLIIGSAVISEK
ncbi:MAG: EamA family transporter [Clostridia bacterium]|nr:EamA family transporter [Clostridia bacterium]